MPKSTDFGLVGIDRKNYLVGVGSTAALALNTDSDRCLFTQEAASSRPTFHLTTVRLRGKQRVRCECLANLHLSSEYFLS